MQGTTAKKEGGSTMGTTATKTEQAEAIERLREWLEPGDTVFCILRHVSRSGMFRIIDLVAIRAEDESKLGVRNPRVWSLGWNAAKALGRGYDRNREGIRVSGCGMDMGFEVVYSLSHVLFGDGYALTHRWL